jgi:hypothetical protein
MRQSRQRSIEICEEIRECVKDSMRKRRNSKEVEKKKQKKEKEQQRKKQHLKDRKKNVSGKKEVAQALSDDETVLTSRQF